MSTVQLSSNYSEGERASGVLMVPALETVNTEKKKYQEYLKNA
jgi:hypothetical protein